MVRRGTVIKHSKWSELCKLEILLAFLLPVLAISCLHSPSLHPFLSYYSQVENGLEEAVEEGQSVHSELRFSLTMSHISYKWILKNFFSLGCALRFAEVLLFPFCHKPKLVDLYRVVCIHSYFTLRITLFFLWFILAFPDLLILKMAARYCAPAIHQICFSSFMNYNRMTHPELPRR